MATNDTDIDFYLETLRAVGSHIVQDVNSADEFVSKLTMHAVSVAQGHSEFKREMNSWGPALRIPCQVLEINDPYQTTNLCRVVIKPHIGAKHILTNNLWIDKRAPGAGELIAEVKKYKGQNCTVVKRQKFRLDQDGNKVDLKEGEHNFSHLTAIYPGDEAQMEDGAAGDAAVPEATPAPARPARNNASSRNAQRSAPRTAAAQVEPEVSNEPEEANEPAPARPAAPAADIPAGFESAEEAATARATMRDRLRSLSPEDKGVATERLRDLGLVWPLSKDKVAQAHRVIDAIVAPDEEIEEVADLVEDTQEDDEW